MHVHHISASSSLFVVIFGRSERAPIGGRHTLNVESGAWTRGQARCGRARDTKAARNVPSSLKQICEFPSVLDDSWIQQERIRQRLKPLETNGGRAMRGRSRSNREAKYIETAAYYCARRQYKQVNMKALSPPPLTFALTRARTFAHRRVMWAKHRPRASLSNRVSGLPVISSAPSRSTVGGRVPLPGRPGRACWLLAGDG